MNYIHQLQCEVKTLQDEHLQRLERIQEFRQHLASPKFTQPSTNGERVDWIATADVHRWLRYIEDLGSV